MKVKRMTGTVAYVIHLFTFRCKSSISKQYNHKSYSDLI